MECSCCTDTITEETGKTILGCGHAFHFRCITSWFLSQVSAGNAQNCPLCRRQGAGAEILPPLVDESEGEEEEEEEEPLLDTETSISYTRKEMHALLLSRGGIGVTDAAWAFWCGGTTSQRIVFDLEDINYAITFQGGRLMSEDELRAIFYARRDAASKIQALARGVRTRRLSVIHSAIKESKMLA